MGMHELGELLRTTRERRGLRAYDVSYAIGQNPSWLSRVEAGDLKNTPDPTALRGLSEQLGIPVADMLEAIGYDVRPQAPPGSAPSDDPVLADLIDQLRRLPLTGERPTAIRGLIQEFRNNDIAWANARELVKNHPD